MTRYGELDFAQEEMARHDEIYRPTSFWESASSRIASELRARGLENFRSLETALGFFVPTYGIPGGGFDEEQIAGLLKWMEREFPGHEKARLGLKKFLSGGMAALSDFRVLCAADDRKELPHLHAFSESNVGAPVERFEFSGRRFSRSSLNYLLGLAFLKRHLRGEVLRTVLEIGGGFGCLGEVLNSAGIDGLHYIDVDIPPMSFVAQYYLSQVMGSASVASHASTARQEVIEIADLPRAAVLCSWQIEKLQGEVDLFVNFISFQEMEPRVVKNYLAHVDRLKARWILMRNMREGKNVRSNDRVGVEAPILGDDYLAMLPGYELIERNVTPFGYRTVDGFHSELLLLKRKAE